MECLGGRQWKILRNQRGKGNAICYKHGEQGEQTAGQMSKGREGADCARNLCFMGLLGGPSDLGDISLTSRLEDVTRSCCFQVGRNPFSFQR